MSEKAIPLGDPTTVGGEERTNTPQREKRSMISLPVLGAVTCVTPECQELMLSVLYKATWTWAVPLNGFITHREQ